MEIKEKIKQLEKLKIDSYEELSLYERVYLISANEWGYVKVLPNEIEIHFEQFCNRIQKDYFEEDGEPKLTYGYYYFVNKPLMTRKEINDYLFVKCMKKRKEEK